MHKFVVFLITYLAFGPLWAQSSGYEQLQDNSLKVLTLNVYRKPEIGSDFFGTERMKRICDVLKNQQHPHHNGWDIVLIQEAWTVGSRKALKNCGYAHVVDIGSGGWRIRDRHRHRRGGYRPRPGRHGRELNIESGLLILSKRPILKSLRYEFKNEGRFFRIHRDGEHAAAKSIYLIKTKLKNNKIVWVANTHLVANYCETPDAPDCESYEEVRTAQMREMKNVFNVMVGNAPLIFGGDINAGEHVNAKDLSWEMLPQIFPGFKQAPHDEILVQTSSPDNYFKQGHKPGGKLDHIFGSSHFEAIEGNLAFDQRITLKNGKNVNYSDHYGWETTFILKEE